MNKFNFLTLEGQLIGFKSNEEMGEYFYNKGLIPKWKIGTFWEYMNNLQKNKTFTEEEANFLDKYGLSHSIFNVGCLHHLKAIYLPIPIYERLKGGLLK